MSMLQKASILLNNNGLIIYMVCSFLKYETEDLINKFLLKQSNFEVYNFTLLEKNFIYEKLIYKKYMATLPDTIFKFTIDGYFAAFIKKIK